MFLYPCNPESRRHRNLNEYTRTNFSFGGTGRIKASTYAQDFTKGVFLPRFIAQGKYAATGTPRPQVPHVPQVPSAQPEHILSASTKRQDLTSGREALASKPPASAPVKRVRFQDQESLRRKSEEPVHAPRSAEPSGRHHAASESRLPDIHADQAPEKPSYSAAAEMKDRRKQLQCTHFTFGNDPMEPVTTYQEFNSSLCPTERRTACSPPLEAPVLPYPQPTTNTVSTLDQDFTFFGRQTQRNIYDQRMLDINNIKNLHETDSVAASLLGKRRKMLTRAMIDYQHPLDRMKSGKIKQLMVQQISPSVRHDSVWKSVNTDDKFVKQTETKAKYSWPQTPNKGMKILYRGCMNNVR